jgi:hypothetical protein
MVDKSVTGAYRMVSLSSYIVMVMECMVHHKSPGSWRVGTSLLMVFVDFDATDMPLITW